MRKFLQIFLYGFAGSALALCAAGSASAQDTIKIGIIMPYSGQFADTAAQMDNAIKLYMKQHGDTVAGKKIELIRKDTGGIAPDVAKRLAQELVVRDKVDILAGFVLTPNALAAADVSAEAKKFMVVMNAATSIITTKSPYIARTSMTLPQLNRDARHLGGQERHQDSATRMVSDYGPGIDAEARVPDAASRKPAARSSARCASRWPIPDFSAFVQRAKDVNPEAIYISIPGGAQPAAIGKALAERGIDPAEGQDPRPGCAHRRERAQDHGRCGARHHHQRATTTTIINSPLNHEFVKAYNDEFTAQPRLLLDRRL